MHIKQANSQTQTEQHAKRSEEGLEDVEEASRRIEVRWMDKNA